MAEKKDMRGQTSQDIHKEIDRTRSRINSTVDQIMDRFSPEALKSRAWDEIRSATGPGSRARETGSSLVDTIRNNPIPAAMAGAGLIILFARGPEGGKHKEAGAVETAGEKAGEAREKVYDISQRTKGRVEDIQGRAKEKATRARDEIRGKTTEFRGLFNDLVENNPLAVVAAAFAIGSAIGLGLPGTRKEEELLGEAGEALREKAYEKAREAEEKVEKKAEGDSGRAA